MSRKSYVGKWSPCCTIAGKQNLGKHLGLEGSTVLLHAHCYLRVAFWLDCPVLTLQDLTVLLLRYYPLPLPHPSQLPLSLLHNWYSRKAVCHQMECLYPGIPSFVIWKKQTSYLFCINSLVSGVIVATQELQIKGRVQSFLSYFTYLFVCLFIGFSV